VSTSPRDTAKDMWARGRNLGDYNGVLVVRILGVQISANHARQSAHLGSGSLGGPWGGAAPAGAPDFCWGDERLPCSDML
jgi:hypothetical protein